MRLYLRTIMPKIRAMKEDDIEAALRLGMRTPELHDHQEPSYLSYETLRGLIQSEHDIVLALVEGKKLLGFALCTYHPLTKEAYLQNMVVDTAYRSRGWGKALSKAIFENLREKGAVSIWALVRDTNGGMKKFLKRQDFREGNSFTLMEHDLTKKEAEE